MSICIFDDTRTRTYYCLILGCGSGTSVYCRFHGACTFPGSHNAHHILNTKFVLRMWYALWLFGKVQAPASSIDWSMTRYVLIPKMDGSSWLQNIQNVMMLQPQWQNIHFWMIYITFSHYSAGIWTNTPQVDALNTPKMEDFIFIPKVDVLYTPKVEALRWHPKMDVLNTPKVEALTCGSLNMYLLRSKSGWYGLPKVEDLTWHVIHSKSGRSVHSKNGSIKMASNSFQKWMIWPSKSGR